MSTHTDHTTDHTEQQLGTRSPLGDAARALALIAALGFLAWLLFIGAPAIGDYRELHDVVRRIFGG